MINWWIIVGALALGAFVVLLKHLASKKVTTVERPTKDGSKDWDGDTRNP